SPPHPGPSTARARRPPPLDRFRLLRIGRLRLRDQAQQPSPLLHDRRQQFLALFFLAPVNRRLPFQAAAKNSDSTLAAPPTLLPPPLPPPPTGTLVFRSLPPADCRCPSPPP